MPEAAGASLGELVPRFAGLLELLEAAGIETGGVGRDPGCSTTVKTRIIARNQQVGGDPKSTISLARLPENC